MQFLRLVLFWSMTEWAAQILSVIFYESLFDTLSETRRMNKIALSKSPGNTTQYQTSEVMLYELTPGDFNGKQTCTKIKKNNERVSSIIIFW